LRICEQMKIDGIEPNVVTYNYFFDALATKNELGFGLQLLEEMESKGIRPDTTTINNLLKLHVPSGNLFAALSIYELTQKYSIRPSSKTFHYLVLVAMNDPHFSSNVYEICKEMFDQKVYSPEAILEATETLVNNQEGEKAYELIRLGENDPAGVPALAYGNTLFALTSTNNNQGVTHCFRVLRTGKHHGTPLDEGLLLRILDHANRMVDLPLANEVVFSLEELKPAYQDFHFLPLLELLAKKESYFKLFELVMLLNTMNIHLSIHSLGGVMSEIGKSGERMDKAYFALEDLKLGKGSNQNSNQPQETEYKQKNPVESKTISKIAFNLVLGACAFGGDLDRTFATFAEAEKLGVKPNIDSYELLLSVCRKNNHFNLAEKTWDDMLKGGIQPNDRAYDHFIVTSLSTGSFPPAKKLFEEATSKKLPLSESTYLRLLQTFGRVPFANDVLIGMKNIAGLEFDESMLRRYVPGYQSGYYRQQQT